MPSDKLMLKMKNLRITTRLEPDQRTRIEQLIKEGKFKSLSEAIRTAIQQFLKEV